jgi:hypothetical protein
MSLYPGKKTRYAFYKWMGRSGRMLETSPPSGFDPRTVQPVTSRYYRLSYSGTLSRYLNIYNSEPHSNTCPSTILYICYIFLLFLCILLPFHLPAIQCLGLLFRSRYNFFQSLSPIVQELKHLHTLHIYTVSCSNSIHKHSLYHHSYHVLHGHRIALLSQPVRIPT